MPTPPLKHFLSLVESAGSKRRVSEDECLFTNSIHPKLKDLRDQIGQDGGALTLEQRADFKEHAQWLREGIPGRAKN